MSERYDGRRIVGLDLHRHRTVMVRMTPAGERLEVARFGNDPTVLCDQVAPAEVRARRELVRHRHPLVQGATWLKAQVHAVPARGGRQVPVGDLFGVAGSRQLQELPLPEPLRARVDSQLRLLAAFEAEIARFDRLSRAEFRGEAGYRLIQRIDGIGPVPAAVLVAELGDVSCVSGAPAVCSRAGPTPKHRGSDQRVPRYALTRQGSRLLGWTASEAVQRAPVSSPMRHTYDRIVARRGGTRTNLATVAAARRLLPLVSSGLRDGEILCLAKSAGMRPVPVFGSRATARGLTATPRSQTDWSRDPNRVALHAAPPRRREDRSPPAGPPHAPPEQNTSPARRRRHGLRRPGPPSRPSGRFAVGPRTRAVTPARRRGAPTNRPTAKKEQLTTT